MTNRVECIASSRVVTPEVTTQCNNLFVKFLGIYHSCPREQDLIIAQDHELFIWFCCLGNGDVAFTSWWERVPVLVVPVGSDISSNIINLSTFWTLLGWCGYVSDAREKKFKWIFSCKISSIVNKNVIPLKIMKGINFFPYLDMLCTTVIWNFSFPPVLTFLWPLCFGYHE